MPKRKPPTASEDIADVLWGAVWVGLGCVVVEVVLVGSAYLFSPAGRSSAEKHFSYVLVGAAVLFLAGFGMSLQSILEMQFWHGQWK